MTDFIPSKTVREYVKKTGTRFSDMDVATIVYNLGLPLMDLHRALEKLAAATEDAALRQQIHQRIKYDLHCLQQFEYNDGSYCYMVGNDEEHLFDSIKSAQEHAIRSRLPIRIGKYLRPWHAPQKNVPQIQWNPRLFAESELDVEINTEYAVSEVEYNAAGTIRTYWSDELPEEQTQVEDWGASRFEHRFVALPNPFEAGDVVRRSDNGRPYVVTTSQDEWNSLLQCVREKDLQVDFCDATVMVKPLDDQSEQLHYHILPIFLEKTEGTL